MVRFETWIRNRRLMLFSLKVKGRQLEGYMPLIVGRLCYAGRFTEDNSSHLKSLILTIPISWLTYLTVNKCNRFSSESLFPQFRKRGSHFLPSRTMHSTLLRIQHWITYLSLHCGSSFEKFISLFLFPALILGMPLVLWFILSLKAVLPGLSWPILGAKLVRLW